MERSVIILSVQRIEEYGDVLKVILKPIKKFPVGYFYTDNNPIARELIKNLNVVTNQQNQRNSPSRGYTFVENRIFQPKFNLNNKVYVGGTYKSEFEALIAIYHLRKEIYSDYDYNFYLDRRNDLDILDAELTKKITSQQAIYYHVKRYVESNPWYAYRYNLFEYCKQNNIVIPDFSLDSQGFMINPVTKERLYPY